LENKGFFNAFLSRGPSTKGGRFFACITYQSSPIKIIIIIKTPRLGQMTNSPKDRKPNQTKIKK
jgi:hypothetical protein